MGRLVPVLVAPAAAPLVDRRLLVALQVVGCPLPVLLVVAPAVLQAAAGPLPARHGVHFRVVPLPVVLVPGGRVRHLDQLDLGRVPGMCQVYHPANGICRNRTKATLTGGP